MRRTIGYMCCFVAAMLSASLFALPGPTSATFAKGAKFTVAGYTNENGTARAELQNFPVLVRIAENSPSGFSYDDLQSKSTGTDIAFVGMDGTGLPFEIDTWNPSGTSLIWVRLPSMRNGTQFVMCWGSTSSGKAVCNANPWSDYTGVWHMGETGTPSSSAPVTIHDSTANGLDGSTPVGGAASGSVVGGAWLISPDSNHERSIRVPVGGSAADPAKKDAADALGTDFHASFWMRAKGVVQWANLICRRKGDDGTGWGFSFHENNGGTPKLMRVYAGGTAPATSSGPYNIGATLSKTDNVWKKIDVVWKYASNNNAQIADIYLNGAHVETVTCKEKVNQQNTDIGIGCSTQDVYAGTKNNPPSSEKGRRVNAEMDEVRLGAFVPSADWIAADYATQTDADFLTAGMAEPYEETDDPVAGVQVSDVAYTNTTVTATVVKRGGTATTADVTVELSESNDFSSPVWTTQYTVNTDNDVRDFDPTGLAFGVTYYVRAVISNDVDTVLTTPTVSFTTLVPGAPSGTATFYERGFTTLSATATVTDFGIGAASATMRLEASTDADFATLVAGDETSATADVAADLSVQGLAPGTAYHLRVRIRNDWGFEIFLPLPSVATPAVPLESTGIGYTWSPDGSTIDFTFGVSAVYDSATCTAELSYGGVPQGLRTFSLPGSLTWPGVAAASAAQPVTVNVTAIVDGATYTHTWAVTVSPGSHAYAVSSLAELSSLALHVGDTLTLPALARADDRYVAMDIRSFSLGEDGRTLKALEPGFSAVVSITRDVENDSYAIVGRALAVCIPEVAGSGRVFFAKPGAKMNWEDTSKWTNVTDPSAEADYPHLAGDVAMAALPDNQLILNADATVAELYLGPDEEHLHSGGTQRLTGKNAATLTFARPSGKPGLLRFTGMLRVDTPAVTNGFNRFAIGGGDGNSTSTGLGIEMPGGLEFDCGAWPDYTDTAIRNTFARARYWVSDSMRFWNIPAGKTLRISNTNGRKMEGDSQDGYANFNWSSGSQVTGEGTFFYDAASSILTKGMFRTFRGIVKVSNKQAYDNFGPGDRGGGFKFRPEGYTSSSAKVADDATLLLEGDSSGSAGSSFGVVNAGHTHGFGSWGRAINAYPAKRWVLDGGYIYQTHVGSTDVSWREDGTTNSPPVCIPNGAGTLCVSNGFNYVKLSQNSDEKIPTNSLVFAALEHAGDGVLLVRSDRLFNSYQNSGWRDRAVLGGFHDHAIGGTGRAVARHGGESVRTNYLESTAPIVPWIVAPVQADNSLYFPGADDDTDELVLAGATKSAVLDEVSDPTANIRVDGTTIAISADRTVNSLVLVNNRTAGKNLGAGRTLTITSGGLIIGNGNYNNTAYIGDEDGYNAGTAGTLVFSNKAYIFDAVVKDDKNYHPEIWAKIVAPGGAVFSGLGDLHLGGDQTGIDDHIAVNGTDIRLGTETTGCQIDVPVHIHGAFARLRIEKQGSFCRQNLYFWDHATPGSKFIPAEGTEEVVNKLYVNGMNMPRGTYGATGSGAQFIDDDHFSGTGVARVLRDDLANPLILRVR